jgi:hypothetical protein
MCRSVLKLHSITANFAAAFWKRSMSSNIEIPWNVRIRIVAWWYYLMDRWCLYSRYRRNIFEWTVWSDCQYGKKGDSDIED